MVCVLITDSGSQSARGWSMHPDMLLFLTLCSQVVAKHGGTDFLL